MTKPYARTTYSGKVVNQRTKTVLTSMAEFLGYDLTLSQGSYNPGFGPSGGTHDGGGAFDLASFAAFDKVRVGRMAGVAIWHRLPTQGDWPEHEHGIVLGDKEMSDAARRQVQDYMAGLNGLANHARDDEFRPPWGTLVPRFPQSRYILDNVAAEGRKSSNHTALPGVRALQRALNIKAHGLLEVDGIYGMQTRRVVARYEKRWGGDGDGVVGMHSFRHVGLSLFRVR